MQTQAKYCFSSHGLAWVLRFWTVLKSQHAIKFVLEFFLQNLLRHLTLDAGHGPCRQLLPYRTEEGQAARRGPLLLSGLRTVQRIRPK